jgi:hypothetical protein
VKHLLEQSGVSDPFRGAPTSIIPAHLPTGTTFDEAVNSLVTLRGEIVHTGKVPGTLRKKHVRAWRSFVESGIDAIDESCRSQCKTLGV